MNAWIERARAMADSAARMTMAAGREAVALACLAATLAVAAEPAPGSAPPARGAQQEFSVDALSVVKVRSKVVANARTARSLGAQREGTGVVIDSEGLVLTIGYLIIEAETIELSTADGRAFRIWLTDRSREFQPFAEQVLAELDARVRAHVSATRADLATREVLVRLDRDLLLGLSEPG